MNTQQGGVQGAVTFLGDDGRYRADTCVALRAAAAAGEVRLEALARRAYPGRRLPRSVVPELSTVGYWDAPSAQRWGLEWHRNEGIELTYLSRGRLDFGVEGRWERLESGALTITRPWQRHRVGNPWVGASRLHWVIMDVGVRRPHQGWTWPSWLVLAGDDVRRLTTLLRHNERCVWRADAAVAACFERLSALATGPGEDRRLHTRLRLAVNELLVAVLDLLQGEPVVLDSALSTTRRTVELFLGTLREQVGRHWTLEEMARQCGLGRSRFTHYCRELTNRTPVDLLLDLRVERAASMLRLEPGTSITEVALSCGFESSQYFATTFRRRMGVTPREHRACAR